MIEASEEFSNNGNVDSEFGNPGPVLLDEFPDTDSSQMLQHSAARTLFLLFCLFLLHLKAQEWREAGAVCRYKYLLAALVGGSPPQKKGKTVIVLVEESGLCRHNVVCFGQGPVKH